MKFTLTNKQGNVASGHTADTKNHRLYFTEVIEHSELPVGMNYGPASLSLSVTEAKAAEYTIDGVYDFPVEV